jgi:hypothetical protein
MVDDMFEKLRPKMKRFTTWEQVESGVKALENKRTKTADFLAITFYNKSRIFSEKITVKKS